MIAGWPDPVRVIVPNNDSRKMTCLNWLGAWLYYIRLRIFLYMHNRWILFFQMRYWRSFYSSVLVEKSAVYDNELPLSLLGVASLNTTLSYFLSLITTLQQNSSKNVFLQKKKQFLYIFVRKTSKDLCGIFVERVELYLNTKVHNKRILI